MEYFSHIIILCVGTNKLVGDCVGPIVGNKLARLLKQSNNIIIYGNMKSTLNSKNARLIINKIFKDYSNPFIITIDAALGQKELINKVIINTGNIQIGNSIGHNISYFSHINIKAVVGEYKQTIEENIYTLKNVNRNKINKVSNQITYEVYKMLERINNV